MNRKKIIIVFPAMYLGGAERSLLGLLEAIDTEQYDVDLFLFRHTGELLTLIPKKINLLPELKSYKAMVGGIVRAFRMGCPLVALGRLRGKYKSACYARKHHMESSSSVKSDYSHRYTRRVLQKIRPDIEYDAVISFIAPHYVAAEKIRAKKKIAWIHTDYSAIHVDENTQIEMWQPFDSIIAVSQQCKESFVSRFPLLSEKVTVIENILSPAFIREQAAAVIPEDMPQEDCIRVLSVGRFCEAKNFDNIPSICAEIVRQGIDIKWYIIGFGDGEEVIRRRIQEESMQDRVIILGKKQNPYPYMMACDLYAQPSRYEGKAVSVREAQILGKPVVITAFPTAQSQLESGVDGVIVPMDNRSCAQELCRLLRDPACLSELRDNIRSRDYSNMAEVNKLYSLI